MVWSASECHCPIRQQSGKSRASNGPAPFLGDLGRNGPLLLTVMLNPFFSQNGALNAISMASGRACPTVLSPYVTAYKDVKRLSRGLTFSATTRFALWKKLLLVAVLMKINWQRNNKVLLGKSYTKYWYERKSWLAGCKVANAVRISIYHCHFS